MANPDLDPAWSTVHAPSVTPGQDAQFFTLQRWLEWYRRRWRAGAISSDQLRENATTFMTLDGSSAMWALTRDNRWLQCGGDRASRFF
ncbi:DUF6082 family protein [Streptomyces sp. NPDC059070]|uniref:DUF6082 family protein n=1 Tax=Streptomyces sp. NPDC059070 TaxID=3346713 RepID=UPI0036B50FA6